MALLTFGNYPSPNFRVGFTGFGWVQSAISLPTGRAMANGDTHIEITGLAGFVSGNGGSRSVSLGLTGIGSTPYFTVNNSTQAQDTGMRPVTSVVTDTISTNFRITNAVTTSMYFGRINGGAANTIDANGTTWSGTLSGQVQYSLAPTAPRALTGSALGSDVTLNWVAPASNGDANITNYVIEYQAPGGDWSTATQITVGNVLTHTFTVTPALYEFRVAAVNSVTAARSTTSVFSNVLTLQAGYVRYLRVDALLVNQENATTYFDGNSPDGTWNGTPNNSTSYMPNPNNVPLYDAYLDNNRIFQAADGEVNEYILNQSGVYATTIIQPLPVDATPGQQVLVGFYAVSDGSNLPVPAAQWTAYGGKVEVDVTGLGEIRVVVTAPPNGIPGLTSPYYIASPDGQNRYAQFKVAGVGVRTDLQTVNVYTGANPAQVTNEVAQSLTMPWIRDLDEAYKAGASLSTITKGAYATVTFNIAPDDLVGFGLTPGSRFRWRDAYYRIMSVSNINRYSATIQAQLSTTVNDFDEAWAGRTVGDFDNFWQGYKVKDFNFRPLRGV